LFSSEYDSVPEGDGLALIQLKVERFTTLTEDLLAQGISSKQAVAAGMPISWIAGVGRVVDDDDADGILPFLSVEHTPVAAGTPGAVACPAGGGQVVAVNIGGVAGGDLCYISLVVNEFAGCVGGDLQLFGDAETKHPVFGIGEMHIRLGGERGGAVDDAFARSSGEAVSRVFDEQGSLLLVDPASGVGQVGLVGSVGSGVDGVGMDPAVLALPVCGNGVGVVPKVEAVDILIIKPQSDMMGMVGGVTGARLERESAGDDLTVGGIDGIEDGLLERIGVDESSEGDAACGDDNSMVSRVLYDLDGEMLGLHECGGEGEEGEEGEEGNSADGGGPADVGEGDITGCRHMTGVLVNLVHLG